MLKNHLLRGVQRRAAEPAQSQRNVCLFETLVKVADMADADGLDLVETAGDCAQIRILEAFCISVLCGVELRRNLRGNAAVDDLRELEEDFFSEIRLSVLQPFDPSEGLLKPGQRLAGGAQLDQQFARVLGEIRDGFAAETCGHCVTALYSRECKVFVWESTRAETPGPLFTQRRVDGCELPGELLGRSIKHAPAHLGALSGRLLTAAFVNLLEERENERRNRADLRRIPTGLRRRTGQAA
ncbi:MAG: hypothetical protein FLDDKLPJ_00845 [Phycisphaerae bacterium]|nr:hypothetical protein [Phycisphaerae bacterium]